MSNSTTFLDQFCAAICNAGLIPPEVIESDGRLHRFASNGKPNDDAGWYVLHDDGIPAGVFGDWRTDVSVTWRAEIDRELSPQEKAVHRSRVEAMRRAREAEDARRTAEAREKAVAVWLVASPAPDDHPYLRRKGVKAHGLRVHEGALVVPMRNGGDLHSLQFISNDGKKRFLTGGRVTGCHFVIGEPDHTLVIAEGYATAASVHEATGHAVACAFSAGNLEAVAKLLREKMPEARIIIAGDNDESETGRRAARNAARAVSGFVAIPEQPGSDWNDVHIASGLDAVSAGVEAACAPEDAPVGEGANSGPSPLDDVTDEAHDNDPDGQDVNDKKGRESQASALVRFVCSRCELVHDENEDVYAIDKATREVRHIERRAFRNWLLAAFFEATQKVARSQSVSEALQTLAGLGRHNGELVEIHIRCAATRGGYVIDLGESGNSRAVLVTPGSWRVLDDPGIRFIRPESLKPLPEPVNGGDLAELWGLVNVPDPARLLVLTWLLDALRPDTPFPLLELIGEQGSAKSVTQSLLRTLIDPSTIELRSAPKNSEDVFVGAGCSWLLAYDNVSHLSADLQDTLCRVATGATFATRKLYTNTDEVAIRAKRPMSINGIGACVTAQDLVDRTLSVELPSISDRRERAAIEKAFTAAHGHLFGGLLDVFAGALAKLPNVRIERDRKPRLIEFAMLGCAVAEVIGKTADDFLTAFEIARAEAIGRTIDASPVATALISWLEGRPDRDGERTVKDLFESLDRPQGCDSWPRSPKGFADALRRAAPALRVIGVHVRMLGNRGGRNWVAISRRNTPRSNHESHASHDGRPRDHDVMTSMTSPPQVFPRDGRFGADEVTI